MVDEAHDYKNLRTVSNIPGVMIEGSRRATDLDMKIDVLRRRHGQQVATLATATPIANSVAEAYTMQRYLRPDLLDAAGLTDFDCWAATFGEVVTGIEMSPDGTRFRMKSRFARFRNVPELLRLWHVSADIKTADDLHLPTPLLAARADGQRAPETVVVEPSPELLDLVADLGRRADLVKGHRGPGTDNMLKISTDGRLAALDLRLVGTASAAPTKLDAAADRIAAIWRATRDDTFPAPDGSAHPRPGALQLVFSDLAHPTRNASTSTTSCATCCTAAVFPPDRCDSSTRPATTSRRPRCSPLPARAASPCSSAPPNGWEWAPTSSSAPPLCTTWIAHGGRPTWHNATAASCARATTTPRCRSCAMSPRARSTHSWQTVTRKAGFIGQVMRGRLDVREIDDIGDTALSYDEVKALATGDPRIVEKARLDAEVARLERLDRAHHRDHAQHPHRPRRGSARRVPRRRGRSRRHRDHRSHPDPRRGVPRPHRRHHPYQPRRRRPGDPRRRQPRAALRRPIGARDPRCDRRVSLRVAVHQIDTITLTLDGVPRSAIHLSTDRLPETDPAGLASRIENRITALDRIARELAADIAGARREAERARAQQRQPFVHADRLHMARTGAAELHRQMNQLAAPPPEPTPAPEPATPERRVNGTLLTDQVLDARFHRPLASVDAAGPSRPTAARLRLLGPHVAAVVVLPFVRRWRELAVPLDEVRDLLTMPRTELPRRLRGYANAAHNLRAQLDNRPPAPTGRTGQPTGQLARPTATSILGRTP